MSKTKGKRKKKLLCYMYGGEDSGSYFCGVCKCTHHKLSKIGKEHWRNRKK